MQKLVTPVQYEPALDVLNRINHIYLSDKAALSIDAMQACKNPVGHGNPIIGKFCKEDKNGALSNKLDEKFNQIEVQIAQNWGDTSRYSTITFTNQIQGLMTYNLGYDGRFYSLYWAVPEGPTIKWCPFMTWIYLPFVGKNITFWLNSLKMYAVVCYGIYI